MDRRIYVAITLALLFAVPLGAVAQTAVPGTTTTVFGIPVSQRFTGLTADTAYDVVCYSGANETVNFVTDAAGAATVTVTCPAYGQNNFAVGLTGAGGPDVILFSVDNMDIMPYIVILITISILFGVLRMFTGGKGGLV